MRVRALIVVTAGLLLAADAPKDSDKDKEKLQGSWTTVSVDDDGTKVDAEQLKEDRTTFKGDRILVKRQKGDSEFSFKLDATKKPKEIDVTHEDGDDKGKTRVGIYELNGDSLKICVAKDAAERPKTFEGGPGHILVVMKREKP